jgi:Acyltransferase family
VAVIAPSAALRLKRNQIDWVNMSARLWPESGAVSSIPALDGLRAVAVLFVLAFHAWLAAPGFSRPGDLVFTLPITYGRTGVQLFFVLSGFLLFCLTLAGFSGCNNGQEHSRFTNDGFCALAHRTGQAC